MFTKCVKKMLDKYLTNALDKCVKNVSNKIWWMFVKCLTTHVKMFAKSGPSYTFANICSQLFSQELSIPNVCEMMHTFYSNSWLICRMMVANMYETFEPHINSMIFKFYKTSNICHLFLNILSCNLSKCIPFI